MYRRTQKNGRTSGHTASVAVVFVNVHVFFSFSKTKKRYVQKLVAQQQNPPETGKKTRKKESLNRTDGWFWALESGYNGKLFIFTPFEKGILIDNKNAI